MELNTGNMTGSRTLSMDDSDHALIKATGAGDHLAFERMVQRYQNAVLNFIFRYTGDRHTAEDLAQEVFMRVYRASSNFEARGKVSTWIFKIAHNLCLNEAKRCMRRERLHDTLCTQGIELVAYAFSQGVESHVHERELMRALDTLPDNQRAALLLRFNEGLPYAEISEVLSVSISSVESLILGHVLAFDKCWRSHERNEPCDAVKRS
jgi:RNA polymerase sigma-70 factor, ECF subfamily